MAAENSGGNGILSKAGRVAEKLRLDWFIASILIALVVAIIIPATGTAAEGLHWVTVIGIGILFFLYGARLSPRETLNGLKHWRLHLTVTAITFVLFPVIGFLLNFPLRPLLGETLAAGMLFVALVPSTVQSSITFVSIARGNIPGAIVSASLSNLLGVIVTPVLVLLLMTTSGDVHVDGSAIGEISLQLLLPFVLGQLSRRWMVPLMNAIGPKLGLYDKAIIVVIVYAAFSEGVDQGMLEQVTLGQLGILIVVCCALLAIVLGLTAVIGRFGKFSVADQRVIQFCGSKKSLATGLPMAAVLFAGQPIGLLVLPLMIFHQIQLIVCAWMASKYGAEYDAAHSEG